MTPGSTRIPISGFRDGVPALGRHPPGTTTIYEYAIRPLSAVYNTRTTHPRPALGVASASPQRYPYLNPSGHEPARDRGQGPHFLNCRLLLS